MIKRYKQQFFDISDKNVILTGGLGFLGLSYVKDFIANGAIVHVLDIMPAAQSLATLRPIEKAGYSGKVLYYRTDITKINQLNLVKKKILNKFGSIDVLINNAALNNPGLKKSESYSSDFENFPLKLWNKELAVNLTGAMLCCQVLGGAMKSGGSVINISSVYGIVGPDQRIYPKGVIKPVSYSVTKGALVALTRYLATYWGKKNIRVNCVIFGGVENNQSRLFRKQYSFRVPLGRMARIDECSGLLIFLSSDRSSYSNGAIYVVDGGWTAW